MGIIGTIIIVVLCVIYLIVLIAAFMLTWDDSNSIGIGCSGWFCVIIGFPGAILALICKGIAKSAEKSKSKKWAVQAQINQEKNEEEEQARKQEQEILENEQRKKWYSRLKSSKIANDVINEIFAFYNKYNVYPNIIRVYTYKIVCYYNGSVVIDYIYEHHNIKNLPEVRSVFSYANNDNWTSTIRKDVDTLSIMGQVINEAVGCIYNLSTKTRREQHRGDMVTNIDTVTEYAQLDMLADI